MFTNAKKPIRFGITFKIALLSTVLVCITAATIGFRFYADSKKIVLVHELEDLRDESNLKGRRFVAHFATLREDALRLARLPEIRKLASMIAAGKPELEQAEQKRKLVRKFMTVAKKRPFYFQIRLIGVRHNGRELVRIEKTKSSDVKSEKREWKESKRLLPKAQAEYFKHIIKMDDQAEKTNRPRPHFVYLSEINLNREDGGRIASLQGRPIPTIRASVPILEPESEKLFGVVVINMNVESAFNQELRRSTRLLCFLTNYDGDYLLRPDKIKEFEFDKIRDQSENAAGGKRVRIQDDKYFGNVLGKFFAPKTKDEIKIAKDAGLRNGVRPLEFNGRRISQPFMLTDDRFYLLIVKPKDWVPGQEMSAGTVRKLHRSLRRFSQMELLRQDPFFRIPTHINPKATRLVFRSSRVGGIEKIADHFRTKYADEFVVQNPFLCEKFSIQFFRLYYDPDHPERYMGLVVAASYEEILADMDSVKWNIVKLVFLLIAGATAIAFLFSRLLTRPLKVLTRATKGFGAGQFDVRLPDRSRDEFGVLARSFQQMIGQVRDRTKAVRRHQATMTAILDNAADGIMTVDEQGNIELFNQAAERIFGYPADKVVGGSFTILYPEKEAEQFRTYLAEYLTTGNARMVGKTTEATGRRRDGSEFPLELSMSEFALEDRKLFTTILRDVSERRKSEEELTGLTDDMRNVTGQPWNSAHPLRQDVPLHERVQEITSAVRHVISHLEEARDKALAASRTKDTFLANMSHELRTPLTAIIGYSEYLERHAVKNGDESSATDLRKILSAGRHLLAVIEDVLDLAKIEAGEMKLHPTEFQIKETVDDVAGAMEFSAKKNGNTLKIECPDEIGRMTADAKRVRQILFNLLGNACKFTEKGNVGLVVSQQKQNGREGIQFRISDTGIGMSREQLGRLFKRFAQADSSTSRKYGGTGLGLVICERFCTEMGGTISVESLPGDGSTFTAWLPAIADADVGSETRDVGRETAAVSVPTTAAESSVPSEIKKFATRPPTDEKPLILVIDDDPVMCELMQRQLDKNGFRVKTVTDSQSGLSAARALHPSVITLDIAMPEMDGWKVIAELKSDQKMRDIPIIMLTMMDDRSRGIQLGAFDFITKPVEWEHLSKVLESAIQSQGQSTVLIVDDDERFRESVSAKLQQRGWQVLQAENGEAAFEQIAKQVPELILLDLVMPVMNGLEFLNKLRQNPDYGEIPVVVMTGMDLLMQCSREDQKRLKESVKNIMIKGAYDRDELLDAICRQAGDCLK